MGKWKEPATKDDVVTWLCVFPILAALVILILLL